jgi:TolB-like protein/DNA-binding winged helix-turn-helix (wHTH) protein/Tfp pilus assembly protein PilF
MESPTIFHFGPFVLDTRSQTLSKNGIRIKLRGQPFLILQVLLSRRGEIVTREELREKLWQSDTFVDFEQSLNTSVKKLRQALCDSAEEPRYIETIPRVGYRVRCPIETIAPGPPTTGSSAQKAISATEPIAGLSPGFEPTSRPAIPKSRVLIPILLAGLFILGVAIFFGIPRITSSASKSTTNNQPFREVSSIAVLPLENLSNDPTQEYFADGMTDELITDLAQLGSLRVISRTSVMHYKDKQETVPQIGKELGVDALVEGTVERADNRVRIRVQLIDAAKDRHLWARSYDNELRDVLTLQSTVARDIASEIQGQVERPQAVQQAAQKPPVLPEAYEAYLKGNYFKNKRTDDGIKESLNYFQNAIALDPTFAQAYAGLAEAYCLLGSSVLPAKVASSKARVAANKAIELDPTIAEGHTDLGLVYFYFDWDWKQAEAEFRQAIELNPNYANAHQWYSYYLRAMGRPQEALDEAEKAYRLDPLSFSVSNTLAGRYRDMRNFGKALQVVQRILEMDPNFVPAHESLGAIYSEEGNSAQFVSECKKAADLSHDNPPTLAFLGYAYAASGDRPDALAVVKRLSSKQQYVPSWDLAALYTALGDSDKAFQSLEKAYSDRDTQMPFLNVDRRLAPLKSDPRFANLVRRVGLPT